MVELSVQAEIICIAVYIELGETCLINFSDQISVLYVRKGEIFNSTKAE